MLSPTSEGRKNLLTEILLNNCGLLDDGNINNLHDPEL